MQVARSCIRHCTRHRNVVGTAPAGRPGPPCARRRVRGWRGGSCQQRRQVPLVYGSDTALVLGANMKERKETSPDAPLSSKQGGCAGNRSASERGDALQCVITHLTPRLRAIFSRTTPATASTAAAADVPSDVVARCRASVSSCPPAAHGACEFQKHSVGACHWKVQPQHCGPRSTSSQHCGFCVCEAIYILFSTLAAGGWYVECCRRNLADHANELVIAGHKVRLRVDLHHTSSGIESSTEFYLLRGSMCIAATAVQCPVYLHQHRRIAL